MPVDYQIDHDKRFVTITGRSDVVLEDMLKCMDVIVGQDAMGYPKLIDTRAAVGCLKDDDFMTLGACAQAYASYDPRGPVAIVATGIRSIENMRRFMNLARGDRPIRMFTAVEHAQAWLHEASHPTASSQSSASTIARSRSRPSRSPTAAIDPAADLATGLVRDGL